LVCDYIEIDPGLEDGIDGSTAIGWHCLLSSGSGIRGRRLAFRSQARVANGRGKLGITLSDALARVLELTAASCLHSIIPVWFLHDTIDRRIE
jgi:hypothetical protein